MHGGVVHIHVVQRHVRVLKTYLTDHVFPELESLQHIGLVHAGDASFPTGCLALACRFKRHMRDALDFGT